MLIETSEDLEGSQEEEKKNKDILLLFCRDLTRRSRTSITRSRHGTIKKRHLKGRVGSGGKRHSGEEPRCAYAWPSREPPRSLNQGNPSSQKGLFIARHSSSSGLDPVPKSWPLPPRSTRRACGMFVRHLKRADFPG
jgi:hypothetical protein